MTRIEQLFSKKAGRVLSVYCTAGFPQLESTITVMKALQENGADMIELGMPYSDPLADGPVIQQSSMQALDNGMSIPMLLNQLKELRPQIHLPVILMGYMNPVLQYGFERFCREASEAGVDGLILPDLPEYEFENEYGAVIAKHGLDFSFLVTPETSEDRVRRLDALSSGFLYAVSSSSTTGGEQQWQDVDTYLERLKSYRLTKPVMVGFGIRDRDSFDRACRHAAGAIIGTAYIRALSQPGEVDVITRRFLQSLLNP